MDSPQNCSIFVCPRRAFDRPWKFSMGCELSSFASDIDHKKYCILSRALRCEPEPLVSFDRQPLHCRRSNHTRTECYHSLQCIARVSCNRFWLGIHRGAMHGQVRLWLFRHRYNLIKKGTAFNNLQRTRTKFPETYLNWFRSSLRRVHSVSTWAAEIRNILKYSIGTLTNGSSARFK